MCCRGGPRRISVGVWFDYNIVLYEFGQTGLSKQCRPGSDTTEHGVWSGSTLFATHPAILHTFTGIKMDLLKRGIRKSVRNLSDLSKVTHENEILSRSGVWLNHQTPSKSAPVLWGWYRNHNLALLKSTANIYFRGKVRKNLIFLGWKKKSLNIGTPLIMVFVIKFE